jgi:hypothetical protein
MLDGAGDSDRDVQLRAHLPAGLTDLIAVRTPTVVGHGARGADRRIAERRGKVLDELEVLSGAETAPTGDDHRSLAQVELSLPALDHLLDHDP